MMCRFPFAVTLLVAIAGIAWSQQTPPPGSDATPTAGNAQMRLLGTTPSPTTPAAPPIIRPANDPTIPSPEIRNLIGQPAAVQGQAAIVAPPPVPAIRVKARVFVRDKPPVAVIEIDAKQLTIRQGSEFQWIPVGDPGRGVKLRVAELTPAEIRIELVERDQVLTID